jgi:CRP-like cAMP-binding protein
MPKKILVIEDNADIRENTAEILVLAGYEAYTAENGKKGVETAIKENPDLIVCDIMMPELDGYGVLHLLRKNETTQRIPLIFLTAKTERGDYRRGMELGADDYITKPFEEIELLSAIEVRLKKLEVLNQQYPASPSGFAQFLKDVKDHHRFQQLSENYDTRQLERRQTLYAQGNRPKFVYYLIKGKIKTYKLHEDGKEYITNLYGPGDFIGYTVILKETNYDDSAMVLEEAEVMLIPRDEFLQMLHKDPLVAGQFIQIMAQHVKEKEDRLVSLAYSSLRKRVAKAVVDIADKFGLNEKAAPIEISREDLAQYVGTATESLIRTLSDFKAEKLIEIHSGKITVNHLDKLRNLLY